MTIEFWIVVYIIGYIIAFHYLNKGSGPMGIKIISAITSWALILYAVGITFARQWRIEYNKLKNKGK